MSVYLGIISILFSGVYSQESMYGMPVLFMLWSSLSQLAAQEELKQFQQSSATVPKRAGDKIKDRAQNKYNKIAKTKLNMM